VDGAEPLERPDPHRPVTAARDKRATTHLQLSDKRRMALKDGLTFAGNKVSCGPKVWEFKAAYPVLAFHILTLVSRLPVATLSPSKAMA
jgi:hypothetical protein